MSSDEVVIRVRNVSKHYLLFDRPEDRLKQSLVPRLQRLLGQQPKQYYRDFSALNDISFEVKRGETVGIIGRNGSGKSTLLQIICGTLRPSSGTVEVNGRVAALLELGAGFNPEFTGRENVYMNGAILGLSRREIDERFDSIAAFADIEIFIDQLVKTYSSGMYVRLAFAVATCIDPDILVVDEALAVGDEAFQRKCFARLEELKSRGTSILFVSHSAPQIMELCDRALLLDRGERVMYSLPLPVIRSYQRLIYAPKAEEHQLLRQFRESETPIAMTNSDGPDSEPTGPAAAAEPDDLFDPGLVPKTTIVYPAQGAEIEHIEIQAVDGRVVNVLRPLNRYGIVMSGRFTADLKQVFFGVHIRSISGTVISGQRYPEEGMYVEALRAEEKFRIVFWFNMALLPDTYFIGGGIWSATDPNCVHRKLDAIMFRVGSGGPQSSFGYCNLMSAPADFERA